MQMLNYRDHFDSGGGTITNHISDPGEKLKRKLEDSLKVHIHVLWHLEQGTRFLAFWRERCRRIPNSEYAETSGTAMGGAAAPFMIPYLVSSLRKIIFETADMEQIPEFLSSVVVNSSSSKQTSNKHSAGLKSSC